MKQELVVDVRDGRLVISIGIATLADILNNDPACDSKVVDNQTFAECVATVVREKEYGKFFSPVQQMLEDAATEVIGEHHLEPMFKEKIEES